MENLRQNSKNSTNPENPEIKSNQNQNENWEDKRKRINEKRDELKTKSGKPFSKWHADRLRILEEEGHYASFIQFIKWCGKTPPNEDDYNEDYEYFFELVDIFESLGGCEFFVKHDLDLPPAGIGGVESTFFD